MALSKWQKEVTTSDARFKVAITGRRAGKTYLSTREMAKAARFPNKKVFYVAPSYRQAKQTVWEPLKQRLSDMGWIKKVNESDLTITLINDSTISLRGADNFDSLRGVGLDFLVMDEFAFIREQAWTEVLRPTLSDKNGKALFISTPSGKGNWAYDLFLRGDGGLDDEWQAWQYTTLDGGRVSAKEIEAARNDLDERTFRQEYEASFETYSGSIYYSFNNKEQVTPYKGNKEDIKQLHLMVDFNVNPMSAVIGVQEKDYIHIIDEIRIYGSNTEELCEEVLNRYGNKVRVVAYPDPAGVQRKTSAGGNTDISILQNNGYVVKYKRSHPRVRDRINSVNAALATGKLKIDPKCKHLIESLTKHVYKEGTQIPDKDSGYDHMADAIGYGIDYIYPIRKDLAEPTTKQPTHWGHAAC